MTPETRQRARLLSTLAGFMCLGAGLFMGVHAATHPHEHHPAWWLIGTLVGIGALFISPELAMQGAKAAVDFLPWKRGS